MNSKRKVIALILGTRPEVIKLFPLIREIRSNDNLQPVIISTNQQDRLLRLALQEFEIVPDYEVSPIKQHSVPAIFSHLVKHLETLILEIQPSMVIVQGDTTSAIAGALTAFLCKVPVGHLEAGLRSGNFERPFPEEIYRQLISRMSQMNFTPTEKAAEHLILEGIPVERILNVGNTIVDSIRIQLMHVGNLGSKSKEEFSLLVTLHRRENFGDNLRQICLGLRKFSKQFDDVKISLLLHSNPSSREVITSLLQDVTGIELIESVNHRNFLNLIIKADHILTDSGGIQEEAFLLGKALSVARSETERPEVLSEGSQLIDPDENVLFDHLKKIYDEHIKMVNTNNIKIQLKLDTPLGDGNTSTRIVNWIVRNA